MTRGMVSSALTLVARGWTQIAAVALLIFAGRSLDIASFGEFAVASALTLMLSQWVGVGCYEHVLRVHGERRAADTALIINSLSAVAMVVAGLLMAVAAEWIYRSSMIAELVLTLAPLALFAGWRSAGEAVIVGEGRLVRYAVATIFVETLALVAGALWLGRGHGVFGLVVAKYVQFALGGPLFLVLTVRLPRLVFDRGEAVAIYALWRSLFLDRVLGYFQNYSADLLLGALLSPAAAGLYRISLRIVSLVGTIITDPLRSLGWTILAKAARAGLPIARDGATMIGLVYVTLCGPLALLALTGGDLAVLALGEQWAATGPIIALLALAAFMMVPAAVSEAAFGIAGAIHALPRQRMVFVVSALVCMVAAAPFGPIWTAASQLAASVLALGAVIRAQRVHLGLRPGGYANIAGWATAAAGLATMAAAAATAALGPLAIEWRVVVRIGVGTAVYLPLVALDPRIRAIVADFAHAVGSPVPSRDPGAVIDAGLVPAR